MGFVVKVRRTTDKQILICKIVNLTELKTPEDKESWRQVVHDEVSVMMLNGGESIVKCYDSFEWQGKLWVILECMEGDLRAVIETLDKTQDEDFAKYSLYRTL